jgi:PHD/YefM family antitoxin component YafN of YafNO toxin-antitoxin module
MSIHPQIIEKNGVKEFVVLPYEEFLRIREELEDYDDLKTLRQEKAAAGGLETRTLDEILDRIEGRPHANEG